MKIFLILLFLSAIETVALAEDGECLFYQNKNKDFFCEGSDNYLIDYGYKYCERFTKLENEARTSLELKSWISKTRVCLQEMIAENEKRYQVEGCKQLKEFAFDTHPICYKQYGVCNLPLIDKSKIVKLILKNDFLSDLGKEKRATFLQTINVAAKCLSPRVTISEAGEIFYQLSLKSKPTISQVSLQALVGILEASPDRIADMEIYFSKVLQVMKEKSAGEIDSRQMFSMFKGSRMDYDENFKGTWRPSPSANRELSSSQQSKWEQIFNEAFTDDQLQEGLKFSRGFSQKFK